MKKIKNLIAPIFAIYCLALQVTTNVSASCADVVATHTVVPAYGPTCHSSTGNEEEWHYIHEVEYTMTTGSRPSTGDKIVFDPDAKHKRYTFGPLDPDDCIIWTDSLSDEEDRLDYYYNDEPCCGPITD